MGPNAAFLMLMFGVLLIYGEFLRPGRLLPGLLGSVMATTGAYWLCCNSPAVPGVLLVILGVLFLIAEALWDTHLIAGILGTISLLAGFSLLLPHAQRIAPSLDVPICIVFGAVTTFLAFEGKRARRNKRSDL